MREMTAVLLTVSKKLQIYMISAMIDTIIYCTLHFDTSIIDLDLDSRSQESEKAKTFTPIISQSFPLICVEFGTLLRLVGVMNLIFSFSQLFNIVLYSNIYRAISLKHFHTSLDDLDLHSRLQFFENPETIVSIFLEISVD